MIDLTNTQAVAQNALDAYHRGELQAQTSPDEDDACLYAGPCAIGVSIPLDKRAELDNNDDGTSIFALIRDGLVNGDSDALVNMQSAHDAWTTAFDDEREYRETFFLSETIFYAMGLDK